MRIPESLFLRAYSAATHLYPDQFRWRYHAQMLDAVHRTYAEHSTLTDDLGLATSLITDTARGVVREHTRTGTYTRPGYILAFALAFTALQLAAAVSYQQYLRYAIDCHPTMMGNEVVEETKAQPANTVHRFNGPRTELASDWLKGDDSFTVIYNERGEPVAGDITLHGSLPHPPIGIFEYLSTHKIDRVTWQPEPRIRVALVGQRLPNGGFVLSGRSLLLIEAQAARFHNLMLVLWIFMMATAITLLTGTRLRPQTA